MIWEIYRDKRGKWRWRCKDKKNYKILCASSQGYSKMLYCMENGNLFKKGTKVGWMKV